MGALIRPFALLAALALAGCAHGAGRMPAGARYVAMGSSFAAGPGIAPYRPDTPERCTRSTANYASLLAARLGVALVDRTCSGATTAHVLGAWKELPAQIDAVTADTRLVTVTIGGNDIGYVGLLGSASCGRTGGTMTIAGRELPCPPVAPPSEADYARLAANMRAIARQVKARAPHARLVFVEYPTLVPATLCATTPLSEDEAAIARTMADRLSAITRAAARENDALVIPMHDLARDHTTCDPQPWSMGFSRDASAGVPWHPNAAGMAAIAAELARRLAG